MALRGIYKITNKVNNKVYIGQTSDFYKRHREHLQHLTNNVHVNKHLQNAWNKYGDENFIFEFIEICDDDTITCREQYWIDFYGGIDSPNTYNVRDAGNSGTFSKETCAKISESLKGRHHSSETKEKLSKIFKGSHHTAEARKKISDANKKRVYKRGFHLSESTKKKISDSMKGRPCVNKGYRHTEEAKKKIGEASKNRVRRRWTEEEKIAQSKRMIGKPAPNKGKLMGNSHTIGQFSPDDELITTYPSTTVLYNEKGYNPGCISKCCRGYMKTAYGYKWKYLD